jgi:opacity protein-like surface antigen
MRRWLALAVAALLLAQPAAADIAFNPRVPVVVATAGPVTLTGIVPETVMASLRIPANSIGRNGAVEVTALWYYTNSANNKVLISRFSSTPGNTGSLINGALTVTTSAGAQTLTILHANNATNAQNSQSLNISAPFGFTTNPPTTSAIDTTADTYINLTGTVAAAGETLTLQHAYAVVLQAN